MSEAAVLGTDPVVTDAAGVHALVSGRRRRPWLQRAAPRLVASAGAFVGWWFLTAVVWADNRVVSRLRPSDAIPAMWTGLTDGDLVADLRASLARLLLGLLAAVVVGVPLGVLLGSSRVIEDATEPVVNFLRMMSPIAWAPVAIAAIGVGTAPVIFLVAVTAVWPLCLGAAAGVRAVSPGWQAVAASLGANRWERLRYVTAPAVRGNVLTALRLALGVGWIVLVPAEMLGVDSGLGYAVLNARDQLDYAALGGAVLLIGITGFALDSAFRRLFRVDPRIHHI